MTKREKIGLVVLLLCTVLGVLGVHRWYRADLEAQAEEEDVGTELRDRVVLLLSQRPPRKDEARRCLLEAPEVDRWAVLDHLVTRSVPEFRMLAVELARIERDRPRPRALLARLAQSDPDQKVQTAARKALAGELP